MCKTVFFYQIQFYFYVFYLCLFLGQLRPEKITGNVWSTVFHKFYGLCHTFSLKKATNLELEDSITLSFLLKGWYVFPFYVPENIGEILMHSGNDLPDAEEHSSTLEFHPTYLMWQSEYTIAKTKFTVEPTNTVPCDDLYPDACHDLELNNYAKEKYDCHVPWFYTGNHTQQNQSLPVCSNERILNVLERYETLTKSCKLLMPCQHARYQVLSKSFRYLTFAVSITFLKMMR